MRYLRHKHTLLYYYYDVIEDGKVVETYCIGLSKKIPGYNYVIYKDLEVQEMVKVGYLGIGDRVRALQGARLELETLTIKRSHNIFKDLS